MKREQGFTLIELAIVLVVIGLVVGGILQGMSLLESADSRRVATDLVEYRNAIKLFKDKYEFYPGDIPNATEIWGCADGCAPPANCANPDTDIDATNPQATCNGNGDNQIAEAAGNKNAEAYRLWQHLSNSGFIGGRYTGIGGALTAGWRAATPGVNVPVSALKGSGFFVHTTTANSFCNVGMRWTGLDSNTILEFLTLGASASTAWPWGRLFTSADAHSIDLKIDDGKPGQGLMKVFCASTCADSLAMETAQYLPDDETIGCTIFVKLE